MLLQSFWTDEKIIAATVGGLTALITTIAGALIALSNSHTIRSWMEQKGLVKKAQTDLEAEKLKLEFQRFDEVIKESKEEIRLLKLKIEATDLNCAKERDSWLKKVDNLNIEIVKLAKSSASAEAEVVLLHKRQDENIQRIEILEKANLALIDENNKLRDILNQRGGI